MSRRQVSEFFEQHLHVPLSVGSVQRCCERVSDALAAPVEELAAALATVPAVHADETGWRQAGVRHWLWVFVTERFALFRIHRRRGRDILRELFGDTMPEFILHSDRWSAYNLFDDKRRQLCWAHLLRDLIGIVDAKGAGSKAADKALKRAWKMFDAWDAYKVGTLSRAELQQRLSPFRRSFRRFCDRGAAQDADTKWRGLGKELGKHWPAVFLFIDQDGVEPTNNEAEQAVRAAVIWRRISQGTRSPAGSAFVERMLSVGETCRRQGIAMMGFLYQALEAHVYGRAPPSLLPVG